MSKTQLSHFPVEQRSVNAEQGCGGFIDISQNTKRVLFLGTFTTGGLKVEIKDGRLTILQEGRIRKFVDSSDQVTFCSRFSESTGQEVFYITERCVFKLIDGMLELIEVAPGIDLEGDILAHMDFRPVINNPVEMNPVLFRDRPMGIRDEFLSRELRSRVSYQPDANLLQLNFDGLVLEDEGDIENLRKAVETACLEAGRKVKAIVNYNGFRVFSDSVLKAYMIMSESIINSHYLAVARYNSSAATREKFSGEYLDRELEANIFSTRDEALAFLDHK